MTPRDLPYFIRLRVLDTKNSIDEDVITVKVNSELEVKNNSSVYEWQTLAQGENPPQSLIEKILKIDTERGQERYLCRALYNNKILIGKTVSNDCHVPIYEAIQDAKAGTTPTVVGNPVPEEKYGFHQYDILLAEKGALEWEETNKEKVLSGEIPDNLFKVTKNANEEALVCRAKYFGALHPGMIENGFCVYSYGGGVGYTPNHVPESPDTFEILVIK